MGKRGPKSANSAIYPPKTPNKPPKPPVGMNSRARRIWKELVAELPVDYFRPSDYPLVRMYCEAEAMHFEALQDIGKRGQVIDKTAVVKDRDTGEITVVVVGEKTNPSVAIATQSAHTAMQLATKLRLATNSRVSPDEASRAPRPKSFQPGLLFGDDEWPPKFDG